VRRDWSVRNHLNPQVVTTQHQGLGSELGGSGMEHYVSTVAFPVLAMAGESRWGGPRLPAICPQPIIRSERRWHQRMTPWMRDSRCERPTQACTLDQMSISCIIVSYNNGRLLEHAVRSVVAQTYPVD
jgi:hypothetical protein